jgi:hypothetical protein
LILQKGDEIIKEEFGITVKISNDNTKHLKVVTVTVASDGDWDMLLKKALELYDKATKGDPVE